MYGYNLKMIYIYGIVSCFELKKKLVIQYII